MILTKIRQIIFNNKVAIKVLTWSSFSTVLKIFTGFISSKLIALWLGPSGIALIGQMNNLVSSSFTLGAGAMEMGATALLSKEVIEKKKPDYLITSIYLFSFLCSIFIGIILFLFSHKLSLLIFHDEHYQKFINILGLFIFIGSASNLTASILNGFQQYSQLIIINVLSNILTLIISVTAMYYYELEGIMYAIIFCQPISFFLFYFILNKKLKIWKINIEKISILSIKDNVKSFSSLILMGLLSNLLIPWISVGIRSIIIYSRGLEQAGYWESISKVGSMYTMVLTTGISFYFLPKISKLVTWFEINYEILNFLKLVLPLLLIAGIFIYTFRENVTLLLFSSKFDAINDLYLIQILAEIIKVVSWIYGIIFWAKGRTIDFIISQFAFAITFIIVTSLTVNHYQAKGAVYGYLAANILLLLTILILLNIGFAKKHTIGQ